MLNPFQQVQQVAETSYQDASTRWNGSNIFDQLWRRHNTWHLREQVFKGGKNQPGNPTLAHLAIYIVPEYETLEANVENELII